MPGVMKSTASNVVRLVVVMACQFVLVPITIQTLGPEQYGVYSLALSVLGFFGLLELGAGTAAVKYAAAARGNGDIETRNRAISTLLCMSLGASAIAGSIVLGLGAFFPHLFGVPVGLSREATIAFLLLGARSALLAWPSGVFRSSLSGDNRISVANMVQIVTNIGLTISTWAMLKAGMGLVGVALSSLIWFAVEGASYVVLSYRQIAGFRVSNRLFDRQLLRQTISLSVSQLLITVSGMILLRTDPIIVGSALTLVAVGQYGVALKVSENVFQLAKQYVNALSPSVAALHGAGDMNATREFFLKSSRHAAIVAGALIVAVVPWADRLLLGWVGDKMLPAAVPMALLSLAMSLSTLQMVVSGVLTYTDRHMLTARFSIASMIVNLTLSLIFVHLFGLPGVAIGTLVAVTCIDVSYAPWLACRELGLSLVRYWLEGPSRPLLVAAVCGVAAYLVKSLIPVGGLATAVGLAILTIFVYGFAYFLTVAPKADREAAAWMLRRRRRVSAPAR